MIAVLQRHRIALTVCCLLIGLFAELVGYGLNFGVAMQDSSPDSALFGSGESVLQLIIQGLMALLALALFGALLLSPFSRAPRLFVGVAITSLAFSIVLLGFLPLSSIL
ncbi:hypothetical protein [uncultured Jatrophihabitans sp.]|uniref:hypothetical protein n=1 Tax=uncultured Jatrophihabitans sp. TaxID=1610747 RepID=UPI0035CA4228